MKLRKLEKLDGALNLYSNKFLKYAVDLIQKPHQGVWEEFFIVWTGNKDFDNILNGMKSKSFQFISYLIQCEGQIIKTNIIIETVTQLVQSCTLNLNYVVQNKFEYLNNLEPGNITNNEFPDYNYDSLLFQIFLFLSRFLSREPIITHFTTFVKV
jgi:hypothetical protein